MSMYKTYHQYKVEKQMEALNTLIVKPVPKAFKERVARNMVSWRLSLCDAFQEAARNYPRSSKELQAAFMADDFSEYIPSEYIAGEVSI